ncbi:hypothetical protein [Mycolicibacterium sp.]|uniref:hypothetical protein n=1 Tax=Mycolicibacterium sp. TaxID=2320850 RepID=UPI0025FBCD0A|nr:hypothetical protein [Mycolicibacterium sp.]
MGRHYWFDVHPWRKPPADSPARWHDRRMHHFLPATPSTVHWGFFDPRLDPVRTVASGDLVQIETLTHHAGDAPDLLMDAGIAEVFEPGVVVPIWSLAS